MVAKVHFGRFDLTASIQIPFNEELVIALRRHRRIVERRQVLNEIDGQTNVSRNMTNAFTRLVYFFPRAIR